MPDPRKTLFLVLGLVCLHPWISTWMGLLLGIAVALTMGNPFRAASKSASTRLLQISIVGLGAGMNLEVIVHAGSQGILYTIAGIVFTMSVGLAMGRWLKVERSTAILVSAGTAICGGSAIAAVSAAIRSKDEETSVSLATVFFLNALGLLIFPVLGHLFALTEPQFGLWSALAIHDTSSVVGAAASYGPEALRIATVIKLTRTLWIVPLAFGLGALFKPAGGQSGRAKPPWFILGFVAVAAFVTWLPAFAPAGQKIAAVARQLLTLTLFLIGSGFPQTSFSQPPLRRAILLGVLLWVVVGSLSLAAISQAWI